LEACERLPADAPLRSGPVRRTGALRRALRAVPAAALLAAGSACGSGAADHWSKGNRFLEAGRVQDARAEFRVALRGGGRPSEGLLWKLGRLDLDAKSFTEARRELDALLARDRGRAEEVALAYLLVAARWFHDGDPFHAVQAVQAAREANPEQNVGPFWYAMGDWHFERLEDDLAVQHYLLARAAAPGLEPQADYRLALALERLGRWRQAVRYHRAWARHAGEDGMTREARYHLGEAAFRAAQASFLEHRYPETLEHLELVLGSGQPETRLDDAWYLLGEVRYRTGQRGAAEEAFLRVLELSPSSSSRLYGEAERRLLDIRFGGLGGGEDGRAEAGLP
jgi:tetratricopeptide (TPR) repeat protein